MPGLVTNPRRNIATIEKQSPSRTVGFKSGFQYGCKSFKQGSVKTSLSGPTSESWQCSPMLGSASDSVSASLPKKPPAAAPPHARCFSGVLELAFSTVTRGVVDNRVLGLQKAQDRGEQHGCTCSAGTLPSAGEQMLSGVHGGLCSHHSEPASFPSLLDSNLSEEAASLPLPCCKASY